MRAHPILLLVVASALAGGRATAADKPIELRIPDCPSAPLSLDSFLSLLKVELAGRDPPCCTLASPSAPDGDEAAIAMRVTLSIEPCEAGTEMVEIRVHDPVHGTTSDRQVALRDIAADARPRALALAVAELVHASSQPPPPSAPPSPPPSGREHPPPPRRLDRTLLFSASLEVRTHPNRNLTLWGVRPSFGVVRGPWQAVVDLEAARGDPSVPLGDVSTRLLAGNAELGPRFLFSHFALDVGICGSLGWVWMSGHTNDPAGQPSSGSALVGGAGARLAIDLPAHPRRPNLRAFVEGGGMIHGADATVNGSPAASLTGGYVVAGLGFGTEAIR